MKEQIKKLLKELLGTRHTWHFDIKWYLDAA